MAADETVGQLAIWDPAKEQIVGDAEANKMLPRKYRAQWVLPS